MNQKRNQGYQRTHESIQSCLYERLKKKSIHQITVGEICTEVGINRSTFYAHFKDVYDVLESLFEKLNEKLLMKYAAQIERRKEEEAEGEKAASMMPETGMKWYGMSRQEYMIILLEHIREYRIFYLVLLEDPTNPLMVNSMKKLREGIADPVFHHYDMSERIASYCFNFVVSGFFAVMRCWLEDGCIEKPEEIADIVENMQPKIPEWE